MPIELDVERMLVDLPLLLVAFVLAFPVGWERHARDRPAGLRTFPIVALATCAFVLIGRGAFETDPTAQARIVQGLMTGIGFIGGGAILKGVGAEAVTGTVTGIATAASIWNTAAIGTAVAYGRFEVAVVLSAANFLILRYLRPAVERGEETLEEVEQEVAKRMEDRS